MCVCTYIYIYIFCLPDMTLLFDALYQWHKFTEKLTITAVLHDKIG